MVGGGTTVGLDAKKLTGSNSLQHPATPKVLYVVTAFVAVGAACHPSSEPVSSSQPASAFGRVGEQRPLDLIQACNYSRRRALMGSRSRRSRFMGSIPPRSGSLESGNFEVYVTPFPEGGTRWLIADGTDLRWGPDGKEVYYRSAGRLMAARIDTTAGIRVLSRRVVIDRSCRHRTTTTTA
jgi:hypothetical protein